ncbi:MAG: phospholipase, partial [Pseudomonadota bacterium]
LLLVHGDADEVVPFASMDAAGQTLTAAGFEVYAHVMKGTGHGIAPDGLSVAVAFMRDKLGIG